MKQKILQFNTIVLFVMAGLVANGQSWLIAGNTTTSTNFIGTRNAQPLIFKTNNVERMRLSKNGQLGIGLINPTASLQITNTTNSQGGLIVTNSFGTPVNVVGIASSSVTGDGFGYDLFATGGSIGSFSQCNGGSFTGAGYGAIGEASGTAGSRYGVYGDATGGSFNAAGYFNGAVYAVSYNLISDRKFKTGVAQLKNSLDQLMKLKPSTYQFKIIDYPKMGLPGGNQMGLIADELKQVFPELVKEAVEPAKYSEGRKEMISPEEKFESVNYIGLIPVLIASIQEQQKTIQEHQKIIVDVTAENQELKSRLDKIEQALAINNKQISTITLIDAGLEQNAPNPFNRNTVINYYLPQKASNAVINITDMNGKIMKTVTLTEKGRGQLILEAAQLSAGTYQYSLIVNGKTINTKKMMLTR